MDAERDQLLTDINDIILNQIGLEEGQTMQTGYYPQSGLIQLAQRSAGDGQRTTGDAHRTTVETENNVISNPPMTRGDYQSESIGPSPSTGVDKGDGNGQGQLTSVNSSLSAGKVKKFACDTCLKTYSNKFSLTRHAKVCKGIENFVFCKHCGGRFSKKMHNRFINHEKYCNVQQLKCGNCLVEYPKTQHANFIRHIEKCVFKKTCGICQKNFTNEENYLKHSEICTYVCSRCGQTFTSDEHKQYVAHYKKCSKIIVCELCGKTSFKNLTQYKLHYEACKNLDCKKCGKKFSSKQRWEYHVINKVCEDKTLFTYQCRKCMHLFRFKKELKAHKPRCNSDSQFYSCQFCSKEFKHKGALIAHIKACCRLDYYDVNIVSPSSSSDGTPSSPLSPTIHQQGGY